MANPDLRQALSDCFASAHLEAHLDRALSWCEENGAYEIRELLAEDIWPDFVSKEEGIGIKRLEAKRLREAFVKALGGVDPVAASPSSPLAMDPARTLSQGYGAHPPVVVKNTFLEFDRSTSTSAAILGSRAQTVPIGSAQVPDEEDGSEDDDEEEEEDAAAPSETPSGKLGSPQASVGSPPASSPVAASASLLKGKLTTFDALENGAYWDAAFSGLDPPRAAEPSSCSQDVAADMEEGGAAASSDVASNTLPMPWGLPPYSIWPLPMTMDAAAQQQMLQFQMMGGYTPFPGFSPAFGEDGVLSQRKVPDPKPRCQVMERVMSQASHRERIRWTVDARKLRSSDREAVSPIFEVNCGADLQFKMVLRPKVMDSQKGGACFRKSRNKGYVELRCATAELDTLPNVRPVLTFRLQVASAKKSEAFRGPVRHNFAHKPICGLPEGQDEWDFGKVVDHGNNTFGIILELFKDD